MSVKNLTTEFQISFSLSFATTTLRFRIISVSSTCIRIHPQAGECISGKLERGLIIKILYKWCAEHAQQLEGVSPLYRLREPKY